jgi:hypothetical protein
MFIIKGSLEKVNPCTRFHQVIWNNPMVEFFFVPMRNGIRGKYQLPFLVIGSK